MFMMDLLICFVIPDVGSLSRPWFVAVSPMCSRPLRTYVCLSSTTIMDPLSAFFMTILSRLLSRSKAVRSLFVMLWILLFGFASVSAFRVLSMYSSRAALLVLGGSDFERFLNGVVSYACVVLSTVGSTVCLGFCLCLRSCLVCCLVSFTSGCL